jgi:hypothetical protein
MDVDSIALGRDFRGVLQETLARCDLMLVLIDRNWTAARDDRGRARLENPSDFVRLEIETALRRNIVVTPVLVQGAQMPASEQLPPEIADLAYREGFELSHAGGDLMCRRWSGAWISMVPKRKQIQLACLLPATGQRVEWRNQIRGSRSIEQAWAV